ncbi:hypothetical protein C6P40_005123 [Pichia californica]|uniref:Uncharacterized protein n=1 Tax=Pichia californica TaxID=460514 RepID=A0A9P7BH03_9ASCO|nr:hypothetical protein C6P42_004604 [[Candida] californica]KAG0689389.1 hypothetical protein C6P40_005123 [[Candida] californica]
MDSKIHIDDNVVNNIDYHSYTIKNTINLALKVADKDKATTDINYIKTLIDRLVPNDITLENKAILLLFILSEYSKSNNIEFTSAEVKGVFTSLCLTFLHDMNFNLIYNNKMLIELFNEVLIKYLKNCNELETSVLVESFFRFKKLISNKNTLYFFQVHVIKQTFDHKMYDKILDLITEYNIQDFDSMQDKDYILDSLFSYFHNLSFTLLISKSYIKAYKLIQVTMNLNLLVDIKEFQYLLSEFIFVSLMTNKGIEDTDMIIIKYKSKIFPRLLKIYQSYQTFNIESFVCNYLLYIHQLRKNNQTLLCHLFNYDSLTFLCHQLIDNKLDLYTGKFNDGVLQEQINLINCLISEINMKIENYGYQIPTYKNNKFPDKELSYRTLIDDCEELKIASDKANKIQP